MALGASENGPDMPKRRLRAVPHGVRLAADNDRLKQETQLLREEIRIKDARLAKIDPRHRPYYPPTLLSVPRRGW